jgi:hypothetical protein
MGLVFSALILSSLKDYVKYSLQSNLCFMYSMLSHPSVSDLLTVTAVLSSSFLWNFQHSLLFSYYYQDEISKQHSTYLGTMSFFLYVPFHFSFTFTGKVLRELTEWQNNISSVIFILPFLPISMGSCQSDSVTYWGPLKIKCTFY